MNRLKKDFYLNDDVVEVAQKLLGKYIFTNINGKITSGMIVETEAYKAFVDKASHSYMGRKTKRNEMMFHEGGVAYVYICYGIHTLLNVVTNKKDVPDGVLIRAIEPKNGIVTMLKRRKKDALERCVTAGPGALTKALGVTKKLNGASYLSDIIWIENRDIKLSKKDIIASERVGVEYAKEDAKLKWRFRIKENDWTSIAK